MAACEKCWSEASFDARLSGGSVVEHYQRLLVENEADHAAFVAREVVDELSGFLAQNDGE